MGCMIATDAKGKARPIGRRLQDREAGPEEFFCPHSGMKNCEDPHLAIPAPGCARLCIVVGCGYAALKTGRQGMDKTPGA
jgi:hypothetical protein